MDTEVRNKLIEIAKRRIPTIDVSHDFEHALRVLSNSERISAAEGGNLDIIIPAALFHDLVVYPKDHPKRISSQSESAMEAEKILKTFEGFSQESIDKVKLCINECSFSKNIKADLLESRILQDADSLEATGAISIMRTYSSTGQMKRPFYNSEDPFCEKHKPDSGHFALDLFYTRLLKVAERINTKTAREIAERRTRFLLNFLEELKLELDGK